jgi:hypothetical protein
MYNDFGCAVTKKRNENNWPIKHTHHENEFGLTLKPTYEKGR